MITAPRGNFIGFVIENVPLCREHYRLTIVIPHFPPSWPGQFVHLSCRDRDADAVDHEFDWSPDARPEVVGREFRARDAFLRRPFSIAGRRDRSDGTVEIDIIGREVGPGTRFLAALKKFDDLDVIGPLGNTFALPDRDEFALLVGGGVGIPPMIYLAQALHEAARTADTVDMNAVAFAGAMTQDLMSLTLTPDVESFDLGLWPPSKPLFTVEEFHRAGVPTVLTTDDGSLGQKGFVTEALDQYLDAHANDAPRTIIYTCGPELMMKRVQQIAESRGIRCQIAVERAMACGMGTCQSCCIRVKKPDTEQPPLPGKSWCYRLACTDGPVFSGDVLLW